MTTTIDNAPLVEAAAPAGRPAGYGLLAAATVLTVDDRAGFFGTDWEPLPCQPALFWARPCSDETPPASKTFYDRSTRKLADPTIVYWGEECGTVAAETTDARVRAGLAQGESRAVEDYLWRLLLDDPDTEDFETGRGIIDVLGHLEEELGSRTGALGLIHAPRRVAVHAAAYNLIRWDGQVPRTPTGHAWVFGSGYDPELGDPPADGAAMIATGPMTLWRTGVSTVGPVLDRRTNRYVALAERIYQAGWDCASVRMSMPLGA